MWNSNKRKTAVLLSMVLVWAVVLALGMSTAWADVAATPFGTDLTWEITGGTLIIKPAAGSTSGKLPQALTSWYGTTPADTVLSTVWPWQKAEYRSQITSIKIEDGVATGETGSGSAELRYMFYGLDQLTDVDMAGLDGAKIGSMNDMFKNCTSLTEVTVAPKNFSAKQLLRMFSGCANLTKVTLGSENDPFNTENLNNVNNTTFSGCSALTSLSLPGITANSFVNNLVSSFGSANGSMKTLEMEKATINKQQAETMFKFDTLEALNLSNATINDNNLRAMFHNVNSSYGISNYNACQTLKTVDMTGTKFRGVNNEYDAANTTPGKSGTNALQMFRGLQALDTVILTGADFGDTECFRQMFMDCGKLTTVKMDSAGAEGLNISCAVRMEQMFANCSGLEELDVSGFGKLDHVVNMDNLVKGCTGLKVLNISNLDNSRIEPKRGMHPAVPESEFIPSAVDWGREMGIETCTGLEWLIADNSKVWMTKNTKGTPGSPYFTAQTDSEIYFFYNQQMEYYESAPADLANPGGAAATIASKRDYIDLMTDRADADPGNKNASHKINKQDNGTGDPDTARGAGILPAGTFRLTGADWTWQSLPTQDTYYRIGNMEKSTPTVILNDYTGILQNDGAKIDTKTFSTGDWANYKKIENDDGTPLITLTYPAAAVDINGKYHDVIVKINSVEFTNIDSIVQNPTRPHENNLYASDVGDKYFRTVLEYGTGKLQFKNYAMSDGRQTIIKGDSGTEIDFTIEIKDALPDTSVLFFIDDLDVPATQTYIMGTDPSTGDDDWCYDTLKWEDVHYGEYTDANGRTSYSEGIILGSGNDLGTIVTADHTGIKTQDVDGGKYIYGAGSDPSGSGDTKDRSTGWSGFSVKANADSASYKWVSGIGCTTELLRETEGEYNPAVTILPEAIKTVNNITPSGIYANDFTFELFPADEVDSVDYVYNNINDEGYNANLDDPHSVTLPNLAGNAAYDPNAGRLRFIEDNNGRIVSFPELTYYHPKSTTFDDNNGVSGANATGEPSGVEYGPTDLNNRIFEDDTYNEHIARAYVYRIKEVIPPNADQSILEYNTTHVTYYLKIIVSNPKSDLEMGRGLKAEVTIGRYYGQDNAALTEPLSAVQANAIQWDDYSRTVWSTDSAATGQGKRQQVERSVAFPKGSTDANEQYPVKIDRDGVEYICVPGDIYYGDPARANENVYLDANNPYNDPVSVLLATITGDVYPYKEQQSLVINEKLGHMELGNDKKVAIKKAQMDVHGVEYVKTANGYTAPDGGALAVRDGVFNPDVSDPIVYEDMTVNGYQVYEDIFGTQYYFDDYNYRKPSDDSVLTVGQLGQVFPDAANDKTATRDRTDNEQVYVNGHAVMVSNTGIHYYQDNGTYYSLSGSMLIPGQSNFNPEANDTPWEARVDLYEDDDGTVYYQSNGAYYQLDGNSYTPQSTATVDNRIVNVGAFNNRIRTSDITVTKESVDGSGNPNGKGDSFDFEIAFVDDNDEPIDLGLTSWNFEYVPAAPSALGTDIAKVGTGVYRFKLDASQKLWVYNVPFGVTYKVKELFGGSEEFNKNGWEFVSASEWDETARKQVNIYDNREVSGTIDVARFVPDNNDPDNYLANPDYEGQYDHVYQNRFTEMLLEKLVEGDDGDFEFEVKAKVPDAAAQLGFSYGWMDEDNNQHFAIAAPGTTQVTISAVDTFPKLSNGKDVVLVAPFGSVITVTEKEKTQYEASYAVNGGSFTPGNAASQPNNPDLKTITFKNQYRAIGKLTPTATKTFLGGTLNGNEFTFTLEPVANGETNDPVTAENTPSKADVSSSTTDAAARFSENGRTYGSYSGGTVPDSGNWVLLQKGATDSASNKAGGAVAFGDIYFVEDDLKKEITYSAATAAQKKQATWTDKSTNTQYGRIPGYAQATDGANTVTYFTATPTQRSTLTWKSPDGSITYKDETPPDTATATVYLEERTFRYNMRETNTGNANILYDQSVYDIKVKVKNDGDGKLTVQPDKNALTFTNYMKQKLTVEKITGGASGSFNFTLTLTYPANSAAISKTVPTSGGPLTKVSDYVYTFTLSGGGSIAIDSLIDLPYGTEYKITETVPNGWQQTLIEKKIGDAAATVVSAGEGKLEGGTEKVTFTNVKDRYDLTVSKTVTGSMGSKNRYFAVKISLSGADDGIYPIDLTKADAETEATVYDEATHTNPGSITVSGGTGAGSATVYLKHGQTVTVQGIPVFTIYTVSETDDPDYTEKYAINGAAVQNGSTTDVQSLAGHTTVAFTNDLPGSTPTGVYDSVAPALAGLAAVALLLLLIKRRRTNA